MYNGDEYLRTGASGSLPANTRLADLRPPDCCPSFSIFDIGTVGKDLVQVLEVKDDNGLRLGALVIRVVGEATTGKLGAHGVSIFTTGEIMGYAGHESDNGRIR